MICKVNLEDLKLLKRRVHVHHINYDKKLSIPENCICLCISCHMKTNFDRQIWKKHFQSILSEKYNYEYFEGLPVINLEVENELVK